MKLSSAVDVSLFCMVCSTSVCAYNTVLHSTVRVENELTRVLIIVLCVAVTVPQKCKCTEYTPQHREQKNDSVYKRLPHRFAISCGHVVQNSSAQQARSKESLKLLLFQQNLLVRLGWVVYIVHSR